MPRRRKFALWMVLTVATLDLAAAVTPAEKDLVTQGRNIFTNTPTYAKENTGAKLSCSNCHTGAGTDATAGPMNGILPRFPQFSARANRTITLNDRIKECFARSENGTPPADDSLVMRALVAYISDISAKPQEPAPPELAELTPDPARGEMVYKTQCAACHGEHGAGVPGLFPPLWGPDSFNDGAGMHGITKMANFVKNNMPQNNKGSLTPQQAYDVAAYIHTQPRPAFNTAYAWY